MPTNNEKFCVIPFTQLQLSPMGNVSACCFANEYKVGSILDSSIEEIWNGEAIRAWRREFISGNIKICADPIKRFQCHKHYRHLEKHVVPTEYQNGPPLRLDLRLNSQCNLDCIMCHVKNQPSGLYENSDLWTYGSKQIFPNLIEIDVLGGEPFVQKDTFRLIDEILKRNSKCTWSFLTNCNYKFTGIVKRSLDRLPLRSIHMSLDAVNPETYRRIRRGGKHSLVFATVNSYVKYAKTREREGRPFSLFASMCIQIANWREISDFLFFCISMGITPVLQTVINQKSLSIENLSREEKDKLTADLKSWMVGSTKDVVSPVLREITKH